jgi:hypothetical protein
MKIRKIHANREQIYGKTIVGSKYLHVAKKRKKYNFQRVGAGWFWTKLKINLIYMILIVSFLPTTIGQRWLLERAEW